VSSANDKHLCPPGEDLSRLADGATLPPGRRQEVQAHLRVCDLCRDTYDAFVRTHAMMKECLSRSAATSDAPESGHVGIEMLGTYLDGGPGPAERERIESHLAQCTECLDELAALDETLRLARSATGATADELKSESGRAVQAFVDAGRGGYETAGPAALSYCLKCGNRVPAASMFCPECGHALAAIPDSTSVWRDVTSWVRSRRMTYVSLMVTVGALFAAIWHPYRKYQFYAIAVLATVKWLADMGVKCLVDALASADPAERTDAARRRKEMVAAVGGAVGKAVARHAWLIAATVVFGLSLVVKSHFAEFVFVGSVLAVKWIIDESGVRIAMSLLRAWRSQDEKRIDQLVEQVRRREPHRDANRRQDRKVSGR
jgi:hypothetical protein